MTNKLRRILDYIPLVIVTIFASILIWNIQDLNINPDTRHFLALVFLGSTIMLFFVRHVYGVYALGIVLFLGLFGVYSFDPSMKTTTYFAGQHGQGFSTAIFIFQPKFILLIVLHFILSWKAYVNIFSNKRASTNS